MSCLNQGGATAFLLGETLHHTVCYTYCVFILIV